MNFSLTQYKRWLPSISLFAASFLWGSSFIAMKVAFRQYDPMVVIFGRMLLASMCFMLFFRYFRKISYRKGDWKPILFMAFCEPCLYFVFEARALQNTSASQAGMIASTLPVMVAIAAGIILKERISRRMAVGFLLAIIGTCGLSAGAVSTEYAPNPQWGNFYEFLAMVCATGYIVTLKHLTTRYSPFFLTAAQAGIGTVFFSFFLFLPSTRIPDHFEPVSGLAIVYLGIFITLGAYSLYNYGVSRLSANRASVFVNLIPVFTVSLGWLILGESFTLYQYMASILVFAGVFLSQGAFETKGYDLSMTTRQKN